MQVSVFIVTIFFNLSVDALEGIIVLPLFTYYFEVYDDKSDCHIIQFP